MAQQSLDQEREEPTRRGFWQPAGQTVWAGGAMAVLGTVRQPLA